MKINQDKQGFTLIELLVVIAVFALMIVLVIGIFVTLNSTQRRLSYTLQAESDVRYVLEVMGQEIRGNAIDYEYYATTYSGGGNPFPQGEGILALRGRQQEKIRFWLNSDVIKMCTDNDCDDGTWNTITTSKVKVNELDFYISPHEDPYNKRSCCDDNQCFYDIKGCIDDGDNDYCEFRNEQPKVTIVLTAENKQARESEREEVFLQTTISSRQYFR